MTCIVETVLLERFPQGLPAWCHPLLKGIQQVDVDNFEEDEGKDDEEDNAGKKTRKKRRLPLISSYSDSSDLTSDSEESQWDEEDDQEENQEVRDDQAIEQTPELNCRKVSFDRRCEQGIGYVSILILLILRRRSF